MREDYKISIVGRQTMDGETDEIKLEAFGDYTERNGSKFISYTEYESDPPYNAHKKILKIEPNGTVTLLQPGSQTRLVLQRGVRHNCMYDADVWVMSLGVYTESLEENLSAEGGKLAVRYTLDIDAHLSSRNELLVQLKKRATHAEP